MEINDIIHNKENSQLYIEIDGDRALIDYKIRRDRMYLTHSEVPVSMRGKGIGKKLIEKGLSKLIEEGYDKDYRIIAKCPFIVYYVKKNEKWADIIEI